MTEQKGMKPCLKKADIRDFAAITGLLEAASTVAISGHMSVDGDAVGSVLALSEIIRRTWPRKQQYLLLADPGPLPEIYRFLPGSKAYVHAAEVPSPVDLFICVDLSEKSRLKEAKAVFDSAGSSAVFDHHLAAQPFWDAGIVRPEAAATACIIYDYACYLGCELTTDMAQNLLCGLMTDTGCFRYQNADAAAFGYAQELVAAGGSPALIAEEIYQSDSLNYIHLAAAVASRIRVFAEGRIACGSLYLKDLQDYNVALEECESLIDTVRSVKGAHIALLLKQSAPGWVRGSLRAKGNLDISGVAREFGGGGHAAAAGFSLKGSVDQVQRQVLEALYQLLPEGPA